MDFMGFMGFMGFMTRGLTTKMGNCRWQFPMP